MRSNLRDWCIENSREDLLKQWDYEQNTPLTPEDCTAGSKKAVHWICDKAHSWEAPIYSRTSGTGCPYCSGRLPIPGETDLATTNPALALEWHPAKNGSLTPRDVKAGSHQKVWWLCAACGYEWQAVISSRGTSGSGCPECAKKNISTSRKTPKIGQSLFDKYPKISAEWDYPQNGSLTPKDVGTRSSQIIHWKCDKGHSWKASVSNRVGGRGCPVCGHKKIESGFNDLATLNPELAKEWHPTKNGTLTASEVSPSSSKRVWWLCSVCGHEWSATINNRTKRGCPRCSDGIQVSFPEKAIAFYLQTAGLEIKENYRPQWLKRKELDIYIPSLRVGIEYDGEAWHKSGRDDISKDLLCLANGVGLIRIREPNCPRIAGVGPCYILPDRKEDSLNSAIGFIYKKLCEEYGATIQKEIKIDVAASRTRIYEMMELGKKKDSLKASHPCLADEWHPTKNGTLTPDMVTSGSDKVVWWQCKKGHVWDDTVSHRVAGRGCPVCSKKRIIAGQNDFQTLYPELMQDWDWTKNIGISPEKCGKSSTQQVWWRCKKCGHSWQRSIISRVHGSCCPACSREKENSRPF